MAALYIHIPFCKSKCAYCNFFSVAGKRDLPGFAEVLMQEMKLRRDYLAGEEIRTLYFGGGTPSLLPASEIGGIIRGARELFCTTDDMEITLEANPEHVTKEYIQQLYNEGVNRLSVGLQAFDDEALKYLGRTHDAQCALDALKTLDAGPIREISADLIFGIPGMSGQNLMKEIEILTGYHIPHISAYALTVEEKTSLKYFIDQGKCAAPSESHTAGQYLQLMEYLQSAGYEHYEISNFCLPGHHSRHNSSYWDGTHYLGIGPSAHSYDGVSRQWNHSGIDAYVKGVREGKIPFEKELLTETQQFNEYVMTAIRTSHGIDLPLVDARFGKLRVEALLKTLKGMADQDWIKCVDQHVTLTNTGKLFADRIASDFFALEE